MTRSIRFSERALDDTIRIFEGLEDYKAGLGDRFYEKLGGLYDQIKLFPNSFQVLSQEEETRRAILRLTSRLHFRIIYQVLPDHIEIQAISSTFQNH